MDQIWHNFGLTYNFWCYFGSAIMDKLLGARSSVI